MFIILEYVDYDDSDEFHPKKRPESEEEDQPTCK